MTTTKFYVNNHLEYKKIEIDLNLFEFKSLHSVSKWESNRWRRKWWGGSFNREKFIKN